MLASSHSRAGTSWSDWLDTVKVPELAAGLQFGISVFEGMQAHFTDDNGGYRILHLPAHFERLRQSARLLSIQVPGYDHFADGLNYSITRLLACSPSLDRENKRIYIRPLLFSGFEDIFPKSDYPFYCNVFSKVVDKPRSIGSIDIIADETFFRTVRHSAAGCTKTASNYTRMVELQGTKPLPPNCQRIWLSPCGGGFVEELDTMALGIALRDGTYIVPKASPTKLNSITMTKFLSILRRRGRTVCEQNFSLEFLEAGIRNGDVECIFCLSTGKGLAVVDHVSIADRKLQMSPTCLADELWEMFVSTFEVQNDDCPNDCK